MLRRIRMVWAVLLLLLVGCTPTETTPPPNEQAVSPPTPAVKAVWIPFMEVNELLSSGEIDTVKAAIDRCFDDCAEKGFNTVFFHVRANSDAYYDSAVFPPHPQAAPLLASGFDPLDYAVSQAHARALAIHAWVNPYRIGADVSFARCEDVFEYGGKWYYDPSSAAVQTLVSQGVREIVQRYAVDGVQFDDYFYPKGAVGDDAPAVFEASRFETYRSAGGALALADWRRQQVSALVADVYAVCHSREGCVFGISPAYDMDDVRGALYADVAEWAKTAGYVDYLCPQLYFGFTHQYAPFEQWLSRWCSLERHENVSLYIGLALYKTGLAEDPYAGVGKTEWQNGGNILSRQVTMLRQYALDGAAIYSHQSFSVTDGRDAAVVQEEITALCEALSQWR